MIVYCYEWLWCKREVKNPLLLVTSTPTLMTGQILYQLPPFIATMQPVICRAYLSVNTVLMLLPSFGPPLVLVLFKETAAKVVELQSKFLWLLSGITITSLMKSSLVHHKLMIVGLPWNVLSLMGPWNAPRPFTQTHTLEDRMASLSLPPQRRPKVSPGSCIANRVEREMSYLLLLLPRLP